MLSKFSDSVKSMIKILEKETPYKNNRQGIRSVMGQLKMLEDAAFEQLEIISVLIDDVQRQCQHKKVSITEDLDDYPYYEYYYSVKCKDCGKLIEKLADVDDNILRHYGLK